MSELPISISLPEEFLKEETRCGYTVSTEMKAIWAVELDMLVKFDKICSELGVKYYLDGGTLLGAVRHQGFIPWDDDIDVIMLRDDYDILLKKGKNMFCFPCFLQTYETDIDYFRPHSQIRNTLTTGALATEIDRVRFNQGIFIDVFVLDGLTTDSRLLKIQLDKQNKITSSYYDNYYAWYSKMYKYKRGNSKPINYLRDLRAKILRCIMRKIAKLLYVKRDSIIKRYSSSDYVDAVGFRSEISKVRYLKKEWFKDSVKMEFEGFSFNIPSGYDMVLREYYGDNYMVPEMQKNKHGKVVFDPYSPCNKYIENI